MILKDNKGNVKEYTKPSDIGSAVDVILHHVGEMGLYQWLLFVGMLPFGVCWAFVYFGQMFITATPQMHFCRVPELEHLAMELRRNLSIPVSSDGTLDNCHMYDADWAKVLETLVPPSPDTPVVPCQDGWEFVFNDIPYPTVVSEREWVCGRSSYVPIAQVINFLGCIFGGILLGTMADRFGRIPAFIVANMLGFIGGLGTMFTSGFWDFVICRFIVGMSFDSLFLMYYILMMEYVGTTHRTWVANLSIAIFFGAGCVIQPWIALWINDWRFFILATSTPMLWAVFTPFYVPESARWLISKGRTDKAIKILRRFERINKTNIPQHVLDDFVFIAKTTKEQNESVLVVFKSRELRPVLFFLVASFISVAVIFDGLFIAKTTKEQNESVLVVFKSREIRPVLFFLVASFMSVAVIFDGLVRLSENLGLDFFLTFTLTSATELPSVVLLIFLLDRFGRRYLVCIPSIIAGLICFIGAFVPRGIASVSLAVAARFLINMSYCAIIQWTPELMPTPVRASSSSLVHISAFAAVMLSPFIVYSERVWEGLPLILVAVIGCLGGGVALLLPETAGKPMPQTMEDGIILADSRTFLRKRKQHSRDVVVDGNS